MKNINNYKRRFYNLLESEMGDVKPLIMEQWREDYQEAKNNYINAFNKIIVPWMNGMKQKWTSQGFTCKSVGGDNQCNNDYYGFVMLEDYGVSENKYRYYFPYESGVNIQLVFPENDDAMYFQVWQGTRTIGVYGKESKTIDEINKAANEALSAFEYSASRSFSYAWPK